MQRRRMWWLVSQDWLKNKSTTPSTSSQKTSRTFLND
ncbi:hypothetical protein vBEcoMWL3_gp219c [Escherichia phage vB_EcoM_WL-3]|nr:hypothetical protein vBEcoMWL3_gp219c [Escherichia phage vB_EcoM_WL-3]